MRREQSLKFQDFAIEMAQMGVVKAPIETNLFYFTLFVF